MNKELSQKIDDLFIYRKFPELLEQVGERYAEHPLIDKLKRLQESIYYLDHHLETNWNVQPKDLKPYWKDIYASLMALGIRKKNHHDYCKLIYKYQKHELYLRENKLPTRFNMEFYYYFKSCDVKLLRRVIYDCFPQLNSRYTLADWRYFDLITEVNDDVEDVFEDQTTINGNYFLISYLTESKSKALKSFTQFIKLISEKDKARKSKSGENYKWISKFTQAEIKETKSLLKTNYASLNKNLDKPTKLEVHLAAKIR